MSVNGKTSAALPVVASLSFALLLAIAVIWIAGYYETPGLLIAQLAFIAVPNAVPLLILPKRSRFALVSWLLIAILLAGGWSYVIYLDTRPYLGGGPSFAMIYGWLTCFVAFLFAGLCSGLHFRFGGRR